MGFGGYYEVREKGLKGIAELECQKHKGLVSFIFAGLGRRGT